MNSTSAINSFEITPQVLSYNFYKFIEQSSSANPNVNANKKPIARCLEQIQEVDEQDSWLSSSQSQGQDDTGIQQKKELERSKLQRELTSYIKYLVQKIKNFHKVPELIKIDLPDFNLQSLNNKAFQKDEKSNQSTPYKSTCAQLSNINNNSQTSISPQQQKTLMQIYDTNQPKLCLIRVMKKKRQEKSFRQLDQVFDQNLAKQSSGYRNTLQPKKTKLAKLKRKNTKIQGQTEQSDIVRDEKCPVKFINNICSYCSKNYGSRCQNVQRGHLKRCTEKYWMKYGK